MKLKIFLYISVYIFLSCSNKQEENDKNSVKTENDERTKKVYSYSVGLHFLNDYAAFVSSNPGGDVNVWLEKRYDVTEAFKKEVKRVLSEARKEDPEMGLGFDPILNAQDCPESFVIHSSDGNYLILKGKDWSDFKVSLKLVHVKGKTLVDGSGIINLPAKMKTIE